MRAQAPAAEQGVGMTRDKNGHEWVLGVDNDACCKHCDAWSDVHIEAGELTLGIFNMDCEPIDGKPCPRTRP